MADDGGSSSAGDSWIPIPGGGWIVPSPGLGAGVTSAQFTARVATTLRRFGKQPVAFILGAILSILLGGVQVIVESLLAAVRFLFVGESAGTTQGALGLEDIPLLTVNLLVGAGDVLGSTILMVVESFTTTLVDIALSFGVFAPLVLSLEVAVVLVVSFVVLRTTIRVAADVVPGLGGVIA